MRLYSPTPLLPNRERRREEEDRGMRKDRSFAPAASSLNNSLINFLPFSFPLRATFNFSSILSTLFTIGTRWRQARGRSNRTWIASINYSREVREVREPFVRPMIGNVSTTPPVWSRSGNNHSIQSDCLPIVRIPERIHPPTP